MPSEGDVLADLGRRRGRRRLIRAVPAPDRPRGKYRHEQPLLFQGFGAGVPGIPGRGMYTEGHKFGPTANYVDALSGWRWNNKGSGAGNGVEYTTEVNVWLTEI